MIIKLILRNSWSVQRYVGFFFFLIVLFGFWMAGHVSPDHMDIEIVAGYNETGVPANIQYTLSCL